MEALFNAFITALLAIASAINNLAEAHRGNATPTNIVAGPGATAATPAAAAKPTGGGGGNADSLAKARAAAAAKKKAEQETAAAAAAAAQGDLDLLGGGTSEITLEMLRNKGMEILKAKKQPEMKELLTGLGAASITALTEDKYQEAYDGLEAILSL